jgi:preprotein translocase subunit SecG
VETILLVILVIVAVMMIIAVLIQRSEGGALGIGGGGGGQGAMFSARGSANFLTRLTGGLAAVFMILSLVLAILGKGSDDRNSVMDVSTQPTQEELDQQNSYDSEDYDPSVVDGLAGDSAPALSESPEQSGKSDQPAVPTPD